MPTTLISEDWYALVRLISSRSRQPKNPGHVYLIKCHKRYKIGFSACPPRRIKKLSLPYDAPIVAQIRVDDCRLVESELHKRYAQYRVKNEWFELLPEHIREIKTLAGLSN